MGERVRDALERDTLREIVAENENVKCFVLRSYY